MPVQTDKSTVPSKRYVLGFYFDEASDNAVLLIRKEKPDWQKGLLNGLGGSIEDGETTQAAMAREFQEEAGVKISSSEWEHVITLNTKCWELNVLRARGNLGSFNLWCDEGTLNLYWGIPDDLEMSAAWLYLMCRDKSIPPCQLVGQL